MTRASRFAGEAPWRRLLGTEWHALAEPIRALHGGSCRRATGEVTVERGRGVLAALLARALRLPAEGVMPAAIAVEIKVLGPVGLAALVATGEWPLSSVRLVVTNDLIWWAPFAFYLRDAWPAWKRESAGR